LPALPGIGGAPACPLFELPAVAGAPAAPGVASSVTQPDPKTIAATENKTELELRIIELRIAMAPSPAHEARKGRTLTYHGALSSAMPTCHSKAH
jgi:hypothetical protein